MVIKAGALILKKFDDRHAAVAHVGPDNFCPATSSHATFPHGGELHFHPVLRLPRSLSSKSSIEYRMLVVLARVRVEETDATSKSSAKTRQPTTRARLTPVLDRSPISGEYTRRTPRHCEILWD